MWKTLWPFEFHWPPSHTQLDRYGWAALAGIFLPLSGASLAWGWLQAKDARRQCLALKHYEEEDGRPKRDVRKMVDADKDFEEAHIDLADLIQESEDGCVIGHRSLMRFTEVLRIIQQRGKAAVAEAGLDAKELERLVDHGIQLAVSKLIQELPVALERTKDETNIHYRDGRRLQHLIECLEELVSPRRWTPPGISSCTPSKSLDTDLVRSAKAAIDTHRKALKACQQVRRQTGRRQVFGLLWEGRQQLMLVGFATGLSTTRGVLNALRTRLEADTAQAAFAQNSTDFWLAAKSMLCVDLIHVCTSHVVDVIRAVGLETFEDHIKGKLFKSILSQDIEWFDAQDLESIIFLLRQLDCLRQLLEFPAKAAELMASVLAGVYGLLQNNGSANRNSRLIMTLWFLGKAPLVAHVMGVLLPGFLHSILRNADKNRTRHPRYHEVLNPVTFRTVRAFTHEPEERQRHRVALADDRRARLQTVIAEGVLRPFQQLFELSTRLYESWWKHSVVSQGRLTEGELSSFNAYADHVFESLVGTLPALFTSLQLPSLYKAVEVMNMVPNIGLEGGEVPEGSVSFDLEFRDVKFCYPTRSDAMVLNGCNFTVKNGTCVGLMGESGAGKSTCVTLLERFYDVTSGAVLLGGKDIRKYNPVWLRSQMAIVSQEPVLLNDSIRSNVAYGSFGSVTEERLWEACALANVADVFRDKQRFPEGLRTLVGEGGVQLSGGEKQRVAIARAIVRDPKVLLLDEATSALDYENEALVQDALEKLMKGRTTLVIAHRLSTMRRADKIVCLFKGQVMEEGTHQELVAEDGLYNRYINKQRETTTQQVGAGDAKLKQRMVDVKAAFQRHESSAYELLDEFMEELEVRLSSDAAQVNSSSRKRW